MAAIHGRSVLELGTGSGSAVHFLSSDNQYTGTDISSGLLKQAAKQFIKAGFPNPEFYVVSADDLPFERSTFDVCLCILSLNFIGNIEKVFEEISRVLLPNGLFVTSRQSSRVEPRMDGLTTGCSRRCSAALRNAAEAQAVSRLFPKMAVLSPRFQLCVFVSFL